MKDGVFKLFYPGGEETVSGNYVSGKRDGDWAYFLEDGRMQKKQDYRNGTLISEVIYIEIEEEPRPE